MNDRTTLDEPPMTAEAPTPELSGHGAGAAGGAGFATAPISTGLTPSEAVARLLALSKRGKLPGFEDRGGSGVSRSFRVLVFGHPYDRELLCEAAPTPDGGSQVTLTPRLQRRLPTIMLATIALSLWPGVWLTDTMLGMYFSWYPRQFWVTCAWYLPLTLAAIPVLWKQYRKSEALAAEEQAQVVAKIAAALEARA